MAFRKRVVNGFVFDGKGEPVTGGLIKGVTTVPVSYTATHNVIDRPYYVITTATGGYSLNIWCDEDSLVPVEHRITFPIENLGEADPAHYSIISLTYGDGCP